MHSAETPQPEHHRHLETTTGKLVDGDNVVVTTQRIDTFASFDQRRERQNGLSEISDLTLRDHAKQKPVCTNTSQYHHSQTSGLSSSELPHSVSSNQSNTPAFRQLQYHHHSTSHNLSNDSSLSLAPYHSTHYFCAVTGQKSSLPISTTQVASQEANTTTTAPASFAYVAQLNRTDSSSVMSGKDATMQTSPTSLVVVSSPSPSDQSSSPMRNITQAPTATSLEPATPPSARAERDLPTFSSSSTGSGPTLYSMRQMADSGFSKHDCLLAIDNSRSPSGAFERNRLSISKRDSLPLGLRNKKMQATDCLLFAATLLEEVGAAVAADTADPVHDIVIKDVVSKGPREDPSVMPPATVPGPIDFVPSNQRQSFPSPITPGNSSDSATSQPCLSTNHPALVVSVPTGSPKRFPISSAIHVTNKNVGEMTGNRTTSPVTQVLHDTSIVVEPKDVDVLCGRGGKVNKHPGNVIFRRVVAFNKPYYQSVHKRNRILVSQSIVQAIINHGGRFLIMGQRGKNTWVPIDFKKAVQKTSQALREFKKDDDDSTSEKEKVDGRELQLTTSHEFVKA